MGTLLSTATSNFSSTVVALVSKRLEDALRANYPHIMPGNFTPAEIVANGYNSLTFVGYSDLAAATAACSPFAVAGPRPITAIPSLPVAAMVVLPPMVPVPPSVALLTLSVFVLATALKFAVPPVSVIVLGVIVPRLLKFAVPELTLSAPVAVYAPVCVSADPLMLIAPAPLIAPPTL